MKKTVVVNLRAEAFDVYIGRPGRGKEGPFGNPFHQSETDCLGRFRNYFLSRVRDDAAFRKQVLELRGKRLGCFCKPGPCHGDVIAEWLDEQEVDARADALDECAELCGRMAERYRNPISDPSGLLSAVAETCAEEIRKLKETKP